MNGQDKFRQGGVPTSTITIRGPDYVEQHIYPIPNDPYGMKMLCYQGHVEYLMPDKLAKCITPKQVADSLHTLQATLPLGGVGDHEVLIVPYLIKEMADPASGTVEGERFDKLIVLSGEQSNLTKLEGHEFMHSLLKLYVTYFEELGFFEMIGRERGDPQAAFWGARPAEEMDEHIMHALYGFPLNSMVQPLDEAMYPKIREWALEQFTVKELATIYAGDTDLITLQIGNPIATSNGANVSLDSPPVIVNDRTMVPIRFIAEALGCQVGWDGFTRTVTITRG